MFNLECLALKASRDLRPLSYYNVRDNECESKLSVQLALQLAHYRFLLEVALKRRNAILYILQLIGVLNALKETVNKLLNLIDRLKGWIFRLVNPHISPDKLYQHMTRQIVSDLRLEGSEPPESLHTFQNCAFWVQETFYGMPQAKILQELVDMEASAASQNSTEAILKTFYKKTLSYFLQEELDRLIHYSTQYLTLNTRITELIATRIEQLTQEYLELVSARLNSEPVSSIYLSKNQLLGLHLIGENDFELTDLRLVLKASRSDHGQSEDSNEVSVEMGDSDATNLKFRQIAELLELCQRSKPIFEAVCQSIPKKVDLPKVLIDWNVFQRPHLQG